jgi:ABC-type sugar transport system permease subunit
VSGPPASTGSVALRRPGSSGRAGHARLPRGRPHPSWRAHQRRWAALLLSPALLILVPFVLLPIILTFWISLHSWSMLTPITQMKWVGLSNYGQLATSPDFREALLNTALYVGIVVVVTVPLALLLGMLLYFPRVRGRGLARTVLFSSYVIPTVAVAIVWDALYEPGYGPFAQILKLVGLPAPAFLSSPSTALASLAAFNIWQMLGYYTVLVIAGLTQIPAELYEAARIDGAGLARQAFRITLPLLRGTTLFVILIAIINAVQVFDPVYILTQGGPINSTDVISYDIQRTAFEYGLAGQASAEAFALLVVLALVALVVVRLLRRKA